MSATGIPGEESPPSIVPPIRNPPLAQIFLCKGCCCGSTDRGRPPVPIDELKKIWKADKLNRTIQLTVSGCLGPCQLANVVMLMTPRGAEWFGPLTTDADYAAIVGWARECHARRGLATLPDLIRQRQFHRFALE